MKCFHDPHHLKKITSELKVQSQSLGFVPTMGDLHEGHASLIQRAKKENQKVCVSLFVNPIQFNDPKDFELYPKGLSKDSELCEKLGVDFVFTPQISDLYQSSQETFRIIEQNQSTQLCGASRPGHFSGMLTVVMKLLQIVQPTRAYFGEKDYQQLQLVRGMVEAFFLETEIVACPIVREQSGLALSSRNNRLSEPQRLKAAEIYQILKSEASISTCERALEDAGFAVDYVQDLWERRFVAVNFFGVRLIDNLPISEIRGVQESTKLPRNLSNNSKEHSYDSHS